MAQLVTIKELEEKYGWGWVILQNPSNDDWATPQRGEYIFHSQNKDECLKKADELPDVPLAFLFFGITKEAIPAYRTSSLFYTYQFINSTNED